MADQEAAAAADAEVEAQRQVDLAKLPFFHGDTKKDQFTPEQWLERVERAKLAGAWSDRRTSSYLYNAFRDGALKWFRTLMMIGADNTAWAEIREEFRLAYGTATSAKITITSFHELKQRRNDTVTDYYATVGEAVCNYLKQIPASLGTTIPEHASAQWATVTAVHKQEIVDMVIRDERHRGVQFLGAQIFIAGLLEDIRNEVDRADPASLKDAYKAARSYEVKHTKPKETSKISELELEENDEDRAEIEALRQQQQQKKLFRNNGGSAYQNRNFGTAGGSTGGSYASGPTSSGGSGGARPKTFNPAKGKSCHYCKKLNHYQKDCRKRKQDNAPMVKVQELERNDAEGEKLEEVWYSKN
jgi:uncharacterized membrane protein YgcG